MQIRGKLLILLLVIALVPLAFSAALNQLALRHLGDRLTEDTRRLLDDKAREQLLGKADDYRRILWRDRQTLRLALEAQVRAVEQLLAGPVPSAAPVYPPSAYESGELAPPDLQPSPWHLRRAGDGELHPLPISLQEQVLLKISPSGSELEDDLARLSRLTATYRRLHRTRPQLFYWQYTALESGLHSSYPGHGGYPAGYDPRQRSWYVQARREQGLVRQVVTDATTGKPILTLARPVQRPDGTFAGVSAIDVAYEQLFADWEIPASWRGAAETLVAVPAVAVADPDQPALEILLRSQRQGSSADWRRPPEQQRFVSPDTVELQALWRDVLAGQSGVRTLRWQEQPSLVAYSPGPEGEPFPLIVVPLELLHAPAEAVERYLRGHTLFALKTSALLLLLVLVWVIVTAYFRARKVTRPIKELAGAASRLAGGAYGVQVAIDTGDELQALGETFNRVGPQLRERETLKQSLAVAREVQQLLLPSTPPQLAGFEVAGRTRYCDETGGDYFDFIPIDAERLAVVVGDITGHGIGSALLMASARSVLRSGTTPDLDNPAELLAALNRHLEDDTDDSLFMTLFYGILDPRDRSFRWASAGHGPAFHYHGAADSFEELENTGIPLGILAQTGFDLAGPRAVEAGDILLIGTDGIWETRNADEEMFGIERLQQTVAASAGGSAEQILTAVLEAAERFRGPLPAEDDLTLLIVKGLAPSRGGS